MRHQRHNVRFGRQRSHYKATMRHLVSGLIINKSITTTKVKAKETSRLADRLVTIAKGNTVVNKRRAYALLQDRDLVSTLFNEIAPLFKERNGGYTRVMLTGKRRGDNAQMAILEFVEKPKVEKKEEPKKIKPQKEKIEKKKEQAKRSPEPIEGEPKKVIQPPKEPEKPEAPKPKPGFFKRLFGHKKESK
ncbi:MAG: 50S ribosomal protein L17 [Candidatus Omnitrophica bacterium]|nr:50S ribosomal protein L17 [Candidatus Omnitrophota bacterium]MBU4589377.1 50S ribosomal protein L17 [Candidatus Omnitrophota bacterium]